MNQGLLPRDAQYLTVVHKAWGALSGAVDDSGKLHWVQLPGAKPALIHEADTAEYGVGALLLAGSELLKLTGNPPLMGDSR
jgi:rhamnogalacturonyl hydrolase YesR